MITNSLLIFSNSKTANDLDLKIPIALRFRKKGYNVTLFLMNIYSFEGAVIKKLELIATDINFNKESPILIPPISKSLISSALVKV